MTMVRYTSGKTQLEMSDELQRFVDRVVAETASKVVDEVKARTKAIFDNARREWPVKRPRITPGRPPPRRTTPHSRDLLDHAVDIDLQRGTITGRVWNTADYGKYIRPIKLGRKSAYQELMAKPARKAGKELAVTLARELTR